MIRINLTSILVDDQDKAEAFYVGKLGFMKKHDVPAGGARWLTVVATPDAETELLLEPSGYDFSRTYQKELYDRGIPLTMLGCDNVQEEYDRLVAAGVTFRQPPTKHGDFPMSAVFEDGCGNLIMLSEVPS